MEATEIVMLAARVWAGVVMFAHGLNHARTQEGTANWFRKVGFKAPEMNAKMAAASELAIGLGEHIQESNLSFTVRHGDPVHNGKVSRITRDAITFDLTEYGITRAFTMKLVNPQERANK
jgi:hypothetical protein